MDPNGYRGYPPSSSSSWPEYKQPAAYGSSSNPGQSPGSASQAYDYADRSKRHRDLTPDPYTDPLKRSRPEGYPASSSSYPSPHTSPYSTPSSSRSYPSSTPPSSRDYPSSTTPTSSRDYPTSTPPSRSYPSSSSSLPYPSYSTPPAHSAYAEPYRYDYAASPAPPPYSSPPSSSLPPPPSPSQSYRDPYEGYPRSLEPSPMRPSYPDYDYRAYEYAREREMRDRELWERERERAQREREEWERERYHAYERERAYYGEPPARERGRERERHYAPDYGYARDRPLSRSRAGSRDSTPSRLPERVVHLLTPTRDRRDEHRTPGGKHPKAPSNKGKHPKAPSNKGSAKGSPQVSLKGSVKAAAKAKAKAKSKGKQPSKKKGAKRVATPAWLKGGAGGVGANAAASGAVGGEEGQVQVPQEAFCLRCGMHNHLASQCLSNYQDNIVRKPCVSCSLCGQSDHWRVRCSSISEALRTKQLEIITVIRPKPHPGRIFKLFESHGDYFDATLVHWAVFTILRAFNMTAKRRTQEAADLARRFRSAQPIIRPIIERLWDVPPEQDGFHLAALSTMVECYAALRVRWPSLLSRMARALFTHVSSSASFGGYASYAITECPPPKVSSMLWALAHGALTTNDHGHGDDNGDGDDEAKLPVETDIDSMPVDGESESSGFHSPYYQWQTDSSFPSPSAALAVLLNTLSLHMQAPTLPSPPLTLHDLCKASWACVTLRSKQHPWFHEVEKFLVARPSVHSPESLALLAYCIVKHEALSDTNPLLGSASQYPSAQSGDQMAAKSDPMQASSKARDEEEGEGEGDEKEAEVEHEGEGEGEGDEGQEGQEGQDPGQDESGETNEHNEDEVMLVQDDQQGMSSKDHAEGAPVSLPLPEHKDHDQDQEMIALETSNANVPSYDSSSSEPSYGFAGSAWSGGSSGALDVENASLMRDLALSAISDRLHARVKCMAGRHIFMLLWAAAELPGWADKQLIEQLADRTEMTAPTFRIHHLVMSLYCFARLNVRLPSLLDSVASHLVETASTSPSSSSSSTLPPTSTSSALTPHDCVLSMWSLARLSFYRPSVLSQLASYLLPHLDSLSLYTLSDLLWAVAMATSQGNVEEEGQRTYRRRNSNSGNISTGKKESNKTTARKDWLPANFTARLLTVAMRAVEESSGSDDNVMEEQQQAAPVWPLSLLSSPSESLCARHAKLQELIEKSSGQVEGVSTVVVSEGDGYRELRSQASCVLLWSLVALRVDKFEDAKQQTTLSSSSSAGSVGAFILGRGRHLLRRLSASDLAHMVHAVGHDKTDEQTGELLSSLEDLLVQRQDHDHAAYLRALCLLLASLIAHKRPIFRVLAALQPLLASSSASSSSPSQPLDSDALADAVWSLAKFCLQNQEAVEGEGKDEKQLASDCHAMLMSLAARCAPLMSTFSPEQIVRMMLSLASAGVRHQAFLQAAIKTCAQMISALHDLKTHDSVSSHSLMSLLDSLASSSSSSSSSPSSSIQSSDLVTLMHSLSLLSLPYSLCRPLIKAIASTCRSTIPHLTLDEASRLLASFASLRAYDVPVTVEVLRHVSSSARHASLDRPEAFPEAGAVLRTLQATAQIVQLLEDNIRFAEAKLNQAKIKKQGAQQTQEGKESKEGQPVQEQANKEGQGQTETSGTAAAPKTSAETDSKHKDSRGKSSSKGTKNYSELRKRSLRDLEQLRSLSSSSLQSLASCILPALLSPDLLAPSARYPPSSLSELCCAFAALRTLHVPTSLLPVLVMQVTDQSEREGENCQVTIDQLGDFLWGLSVMDIVVQPDASKPKQPVSQDRLRRLWVCAVTQLQRGEKLSWPSLCRLASALALSGYDAEASPEFLSSVVHQINEVLGSSHMDTADTDDDKTVKQWQQLLRFDRGLYRHQPDLYRQLAENVKTDIEPDNDNDDQEEGSVLASVPSRAGLIFPPRFHSALQKLAAESD